MSDAILAQLQRIEDKVDAQAIQGATIVERLGNVKTALDSHISADDTVHKIVENRVTSLEHFRTSWKSRVASWAVVGAGVVSLVVAFAKDAIAGIFQH